ncbi:hypothetical protein ATL41_2067 [Flavimobilis soli]|uniref:YdbS-like PH domain-containing protein n=1 Tax=Flavimobilis soli TaxID=442709 RepID=A0A2A9EGE3_9MICO|nr:PH domain-containing protein [Flavimobilis soli]PFG37312.1 hypothetical protein ATL41_2067 [Flavimobilis soli]
MTTEQTPTSEHVTISTSPFDPDGIAWQRVSLRLVTARQIIAAIFLGLPTIAAAVVAVLVTPWVWIGAGAVGLVWLWVAIIIWRQVRAIGYVEREDDLLLRKGVMFRSLVVVPYGRMQYVDVTAGPLARALGIASVQLHTAAPGTDATIDGLEPAEAARLRDRLASRGEAQLAGL